MISTIYQVYIVDMTNRADIIGTISIMQSIIPNIMVPYSEYTHISYAWIPIVCKAIAWWAVFNGFGPFATNIMVPY